MAIAKNQVVVVDYKLQNGNGDGDLIEETFGSDPLSFIFGIGQMIPAFEANLENTQEGDEFSFLIEAANGYGLFEDEAVVQIPLQQFAQDGKVSEESIQVGRQLTVQDQQGQTYHGVVQSADSENVTVDFNHPMAGTDLYFTGVVRTVRDATESELDHGHAHE
ncbi:MAG: peptidylprolyl isomerase [Saprospiraceae bacterium]|nr:peptidylprolyl isomerase [Saprospiraceae bacterium]